MRNVFPPPLAGEVPREHFASKAERGRVKETTIVRFAAFVLPFLLTPHWVKARNGCETTLSRAKYEAGGGKLVVTVPPNLSKFPYNFFCDFVPCGGTVRIAAIVRENGSVKVLGVDHNDWDADPPLHGSILAQRVAAMRFAPPRASGKPVCVRFEETLTSNQYKAPSMIKHSP